MKNHLRKFISLIMCVLMIADVFSCLSGFVSATAASKITVGVVCGYAGDTVSVPIKISDNPGIVAMGISITYDSSKVSLVSVSNGEIFDDDTFVYGSNTSANPFVLTWEDGLSPDNTSNGTLATLVFKIKSGATGSAAVSVSYTDGNIFNYNLDNVNFAVENNSIIILGESTNTDYAVGDYIYYGSYPQAEVTDNATITALNNCSGTWVSYNYYSGTGSYNDGTMVESDYMRYKDVTYSGVKYRAVTFDSYRPWATGLSSLASYTCQDDNGYTTDNVYWFKYEPIKWRVLDPLTGLVMCATVIDSQAYNNFVLESSNIYYGDSNCTFYASDYVESSIRQWLNDDFYNTAFSYNQKSNIKSVTLDNISPRSSDYDALSTTDKVFLLSYADTVNSDYGFKSGSSADASKILNCTDYAKSQGAELSQENCYTWWLRSPAHSGYSYIAKSGKSNEWYFASYTSVGVVPAIELETLKSDTEYDYSVGDFIYFGTYPQTKVTDSAIITALNNCSGTWVSYGYYSGSGTWYDGQMIASDYMRYKDVSYNGDKYRAVTFDCYRPYCTGYTSSTSYTYQDDNGYTTGNVYWFKYEPIKWRVLDPSTGLVMCDTIIDSQAYNNYILKSGTDEYSNTAYWGDSAKTYYANNYAESSIREWLNNDFYNTAFSDDQKSNILTTTLDNSAYSTSYSAYDSVSTSDKVYLLSYSDVLNSSYGFATSIGTEDTARQLKGSDYAKAQGLLVYSSSGSTYDGCSYWRLRSAGCYSHFSRSVYIDGVVDIYYGAGRTGSGVVPALNLQNLKSDYAGSEIVVSNGDGTHSFYDGNSALVSTDNCTYEYVTTAATCTAAGKNVYTCTGCGYSYTETIQATGHSLIKEKIVPTCTADGKIIYTCSVCQSVLGVEYIPALGHYYTYIYNNDATTESDGTETQVCSNCGAKGTTRTREGTKIPTYTVYFDANGGTEAPASQTKIQGEELTLTTEIPTRPGCTFLGWSETKSADTADYYPGSVYTDESSTVLYAVWQVGEYKITLNANGGKFRDGSSSKIMKYNGGDEVYPQNFDEPVRSGYKFMGWSDASDSTDKVYGSAEALIVTGDKTYYAVWKNTFTITLDANDGKFADGSNEKTLIYYYGDEVYPEYFEVPSRDGYTFLGWSSEKNSNSVFGSGYKAIVDDDKVYYAVWRQNFDLDYDANGGKNAPEKQTGSYTYTISESVPERDGYNFLGWAKLSTATTPKYQPGETITLTEKTTLYAVWQIITYTVSYDANGGESAPASQIKTYGEDLTITSEEAVRSTYTFLGWSTDKTAESPEYKAGDSYKTDSDITLYAVWEENYFVITINANGGLFKDGSSFKELNYREGNKVYPENFDIPERDGYTFIGWSEIKSSSNCSYGSGDFMTVISNKTLYAVWETGTDSYTVAYDANEGTGAPESQQKTKDVDLILSTVVPERVGYDFAGWAESKTATQASYHPGDTYTENKSVTLFAVWTEREYTVTFDAAEGAFEDGSTEKILKFCFGDAVTEIEEEPSRNGYNFVGWTELPSSMPAQDVTVYAEWVKESSFTQSNRYHFDNSSSNFCTDWSDNSYYMSEADQAKLFNYITRYDSNAATTISEVQTWFSQEWGGSCYGMASTTVLDYQNRVAFNENFGTDAETMWEVESPSTNSELMSAINYYMVSQSIPFVRNSCVSYFCMNSDWNVGLKELIKEAQKGDPFLFCFYTYADFGHAIVALDCSVGDDGNYYIRAYDNNFPNQDVNIVVSSDFDSCYVDAYVEYYGWAANCYGIQIYKDMSGFDKIDIDGENNDMNITYDDYRYSNSNTFISMVADGNITVTNKSGETITYSNGTIGGTMDIINTYFIIRDDVDGKLGKVELVFEVAPSKSYTFESSSDNMDVSVKSSGMYASASSENADYIVVGDNEGVYVVGDEMTYSAALSSKDTAYDTVIINGNADKDVSVTYSGDNILIRGFDTTTDTLTIYADSIEGNEYNLDDGYSDVQVTSDNDKVDVKASSDGTTNYDTSIIHKHSYVEKTTKKALCNQEGLKTYTCSCGDSYTVVIEMTDHSYQWVYNNDATTEKDGTETQVCIVCGATGDTRAKEGSMLTPEHAHSYTETVTKQPTCTAQGVMTYTCSCGDNYTALLPKVDHKDANSNGYCDDCGTLVNADLAYPCGNAKINIASAKTLDYRTKTSIKATATGIPEGYYLVMTINGTEVIGSNTEVSYNAGELKGNISYSVRVVDANGNNQTDANGNILTKGSQVNCNSSFFTKLIAFLKGLFGALPSKTVQP